MRKKAENHLQEAFYLVTWIVAALLLLSIVPEFSVGGFHFKRIDLLSDIQKESDLPVAKKDTVKKPVKTPLIKKEPCKPGVTCIEDFSPERNALGNFFNSLYESRRRTVKVAFFGDSFIEGDILCSSLRDTLQSIFGGRGVGYVPITSEVTSFRTTIQHSYSGWKTFWIVGDKNPFSPPGFSGHCFVPEEGNDLEYKPGRKRYPKFDKLKVFYKAAMPSALQYTLNDTIVSSQPLIVSDTLQQEILPSEGAASVKLHFEPYDSLKLYGVSFESGTGLYVDNFSMRGNSGIGLYQIDPIQLREFNKYQRYRLVLLQYGLNVVTETDSAGYDWYVEKMVRVINRLKENLPGSSFLLISVSDRCYNKNGKFVTIPNMQVMRNAQREIARKCKIAFWDLLSAMKGEISMVKMTTANPPLASKDYTHVNFAGGRKLASQLANALLTERGRYESSRKKRR